MPTTDQSLALNQRDSARVEKRGPSMTTRVPPSVGDHCAARPDRQDGVPAGGAVGVGDRDVDRALVVVGLHASARAVDELVGDDERAGPEVRSQPADRARGQHLADAERAQRPEVGAVGDLVRRESVVATVPGQEGHPAVADRADDDRVATAGRRASRR